MSVTKQQALDAYNAGVPIISDSEWDSKFANNDGTDSLGKGGKVDLPVRMGSLKKYFIEEDTLPDTTGYVKSVKLDGCAGGLLFRDGQLVMAATRGNGLKGQDITDKAEYLRILGRIPTYLVGTLSKRNVWITGEFVARKSVDNSRNYVAGFLNTKSKEDFVSKASEIYFVAYSLSRPGDIPLTTTYLEDMLLLEESGFETVSPRGTATDAMLEFPTDGVVYRINDNKIYFSSGFTGNYKNSAFAVKERSEGVITTLLDIQWQTGKSGKVTPVAILEPVLIGEAMVSRATLHNWNFIEQMGLTQNCQVLVERSGEIIPRIIGLANE